MARAPRRDDEDELDPVEAADVDSDEEDELDGFVEDDVDLDVEDETVLDDELEDDDADVDLDDEDEDEDVLVAPVFDDEDEIVAAVEADDDEEDDDVDGLREGEFVCRSCFMAKRESALADPERMLCRDCA